MPPKNKKIIKINAISQAHLIKEMLDGTLTCKELAEETGLHYVTVLQYARTSCGGCCTYLLLGEGHSRTGFH